MKNRVKENRVRFLPARSRGHHNADLPWWQILGAGVIFMGGFGLLIGLIPHYSLYALTIGLGLAVIGVIAGFWSWWNYSWWARFIVTGIWSLMLFGITARAWESVVPVPESWFVPLLTTYFLAWALPVISPSISIFLWQEQTTPQTRIGRRLLALSLSLTPAAGVFGASIGIFGSRFEETKGAIFILAILGSMAMAIITFTISYQLWPERPWANRKIAERRS